jgi:hypothetical protein
MKLEKQSLDPDFSRSQRTHKRQEVEKVEKLYFEITTQTNNLIKILKKTSPFLSTSFSFHDDGMKKFLQM